MTKNTIDFSQLPKDEHIQTLCHFINDALEEMKALNIVFINVKDITSVCDVMVIASGSSSRHTKSIADYLIEHAKKHHFEILGSEGQDTSEWILIDLGDVLVHIMQETTRAFYELEKLWGQKEERKESQHED